MSELASFSESSRQSALQRFQLLRAHLEDGGSLAAMAPEAKISYRTLVTLDHQGSKACSNFFDLIYRSEAARSKNDYVIFKTSPLVP